MNRWSKAGVLARLFEHLQREQIIRLKIEVVSLESTIVKVHPEGTGAFKKTGRKPSENPEAGWTTEIHLVAAKARCALTLALSPGQAGDGPAGRELWRNWGRPAGACHLIMDRAYQGNKTLQLDLELSFTPVVPPNLQQLWPWYYDRALYAKRTEVERLFRRLKGFRRIFSRFDKLDVMFLTFLHFALIFEAFH